MVTPLQSNLIIRADGLVRLRDIPKNTRIRGFASVSSPSAQYSATCEAGFKHEEFRNIVYSVAHDYQTLPLAVRYIIWIQYHSGCRINEVLALRASDCNSNNDIKLKASKWGLARIVRIPLLENMTVINVRSVGLIFDDYDRFYIYRLCKARGIYFRKGNLKVDSVTHSFRAAYAASILEVSEQSMDTARAMGHKSAKTIEYYAKSNKK